MGEPLGVPSMKSVKGRIMKRTALLLALVPAFGVLSGCGQDEERKAAPAATRMAVPPGMMTTTTPATQKDVWLHVPTAAATLPGADGFQITQDGMLFKDELVGNGPLPEIGQILNLRYTISHADKSRGGEIISNAHDTKSRAESLALGRPGDMPLVWHEAAATMKRGGKRRLLLPAARVFEDRTKPSGVAADETLLVDLELTEITGEGRDAATRAASTMPTTVPTDLVIEDQKVGDGAVALNGKRVSVHYTGRLLDGSKFDSSVDRGTPYPFTLGRREVIEGWDLGVAGMKVGGKRKLTIPARLAYGPEEKRNQEGKVTIPANSTLVFEVELLGVE